MASEFSIAQIISFAKQAQVNSQIKISKAKIFQGAVLDPLYSRKLYMYRTALEFMYLNYPANSTLRQIAEYVYALSRPFIQAAATISITNPTNQSVNVGQNATFSVSVFVSNATPFTIQWFRNNVAIPGATSTSYTLNNAQLTDSGATFYAVASANGVGTATSATATLTVTAIIQGFFAYMPTDPFPTLNGGTDPFSYQVTFNITHNQQISITMPSASAPNQYLIVKTPSTEPVYQTWFNDVFNNGTLGNTGDFDWQPYLTFGGFNYYSSRQALSLNTSQPLLFNP
jgi:hypothetical protein